MTRVLKLTAAAAGAALITAAAFLLHPRSRFRVNRSDDTLADRVRAALASGSGREEGITIRASRGVVTLRGEVDEITDITRLDDAVREVSGVADVDNLLRLRAHSALRPHILTA